MERASAAGARDVDPPEQQLLAQRGVPVAGVGDDLASRLRELIAGRPVYAHLDCDVLEPGIVPTDYRVPGGLDLAMLTDVASAVAGADLVGVEIAELEDTPAGEPAPELDPLLEALSPLIDVVTAGRCE